MIYYLTQQNETKMLGSVSLLHYSFSKSNFSNVCCNRSNLPLRVSVGAASCVLEDLGEIPVKHYLCLLTSRVESEILKKLIIKSYSQIVKYQGLERATNL